MWKSCSYETVGRAHVTAGLGCQDKTLRRSHKGVELIALADGAGSVRHAEAGALAAVEAIGEVVCHQFEALLEHGHHEAKFQIYETVLNRLEQRRLELGCRLEELASTLLLAAIKGNDYLVIHLGDGVVGYLESGALKVATKPQTGEFANETIFTTSAQARESLRVLKGQVGQIDGFFMMSDGAAHSLYDHRRMSFAPAIKEMLRANGKLENEKATRWVGRIFDQHIVTRTMDDCSIAILSRSV